MENLNLDQHADEAGNKTRLIFECLVRIGIKIQVFFGDVEF